MKCNITKDLVPQLKKMATDTIKACSRKVDPHRRHNTFEVRISRYYVTVK